MRWSLQQPVIRWLSCAVHFLESKILTFRRDTAAFNFTSSTYLFVLLCFCLFMFAFRRCEQICVSQVCVYLPTPFVLTEDLGTMSEEDVGCNNEQIACMILSWAPPYDFPMRSKMLHVSAVQYWDIYNITLCFSQLRRGKHSITFAFATITQDQQIHNPHGHTSSSTSASISSKMTYLDECLYILVFLCTIRIR